METRGCCAVAGCRNVKRREIERGKEVAVG